MCFSLVGGEGELAEWQRATAKGTKSPDKSECTCIWEQENRWKSPQEQNKLQIKNKNWQNSSGAAEIKELTTHSNSLIYIHASNCWW